MLSEINIPSNVRSIGDYCFNGCIMLPKINIPSSVTSIGECCFINCSTLAEMRVTEGNLVYDSRENCNAIINTSANQLEYGCSGTTIPLDVTSIKQSAFVGSGLKSIIIPNNIKAIECGPGGGYNPFARCEIEKLVIDMDTIVPVFQKMESLKEVVLGEHVRRSETHAFYGCNSLITLSLSEGISEIAEGMFLDCTSLDNVIIPGSIGSIGSSAFQGCSQLKKMIISEGVEVINNQAFMDCVQLESLSLPSTIKEVGSLAFFNTLWYNNQPDGIIYFGPIVYAYKGDHSIENEINLEIREGSTIIVSSAFSGCKGLKSIILPNSINSIGSSAFQGCISLRRIGLPDSLSIISWGLFDGCTALEEIVIPAGVVKIEEWAFNNCSSLQSISIPNGVSSLGGRVFYGCSSLKSITIPSGMKRIEGWAFAYCTNLQSLIIEEGDDDLVISKSPTQYPAFHNCPIIDIYLGRRINISYGNVAGFNPTLIRISTKKSIIESNLLDNVRGYIYSIIIPKNIKKIETKAFQQCSNLHYVEFEDGTDNLDCCEGYTFYACPLDSIYLGRNVSFSQNSPFRGNRERLSTVKFGNCVLEITDGLFVGHKGLTSIVFPSSIQKIGSQSFYGCDGLQSISIPNNVNEIGKDAFDMCRGLRSFVIEDGQETLSIDNNFMNCELKKVYLGRNIVYPEPLSPFSGLDYLDSLVIGSKVNKVGKSAFASCRNLKEVVSYSEVVPETDEYAFTHSYLPSATLRVPYSLFDQYCVTVPWSLFGSIKNFEGMYNLVYLVDGEEYKKYVIEQGSSISAEEEPTREGYTFSGWCEIPETMPDHDVTVTGTFSINSYKLTYMIDDKVYKEIMYEYGATITPEPQPEGDYATFEWTDLPQTMPAHDVVVYASYTSGIIEVFMASEHNVRIYSPNGKKLNKLQKGINIVIRDDGTVKKVMMK